jgi:hypothetical protein
MITANVLTQYDASTAHQPSADTVATKSRSSAQAATTATTTLPLAAETATETVSLSPAALALQHGETSGHPPALTYSMNGSARRNSEPGQPVATQPATQATPDITQRKLTDKLQAAGIATSPQFDVRMDNRTQQVQVLGNRPDAPRIEQVINNDPALQQALSNSTALPQASTQSNRAEQHPAPAQPGTSRASKRLAASYQDNKQAPVEKKNIATSA